MGAAWLADQLGLLAAILVPPVLLAGLSRRPRPAGCCGLCGYDLAGLPLSAVCPECGGSDRGRGGPLYAPRTWRYEPRLALLALVMVPPVLLAAVLMPGVIGDAWNAVHRLVGVPLAPTPPASALAEMHACFSVAYIGAFAAATVPLARLRMPRALAAAAAVLALGAAVQLVYLVADRLTGHAWSADAIIRQRFVFAVFALLLLSLTVATVDPAMRGRTRRMLRD